MLLTSATVALVWSLALLLLLAGTVSRSWSWTVLLAHRYDISYNYKICISELKIFISSSDQYRGNMLGSEEEYLRSLFGFGEDFICSCLLLMGEKSKSGSTLKKWLLLGSIMVWMSILLGKKWILPVAEWAWCPSCNCRSLLGEPILLLILPTMK